MSTNFTNTTLLIQYMDKELSAEEQTAVEKNMELDTSLQDELENLQYTRLCVNSLGLRKQISMVHSEMMAEFENEFKPVAKVRTLGRILMRVAASVLLLIIAGATYQYFNLSSEKLVSENYTEYTIGTSRAGDDLTPIEKAFRQKEFKTVLSIFNGITEPGPKDYFLAGNAFLETGATAKAIDQFRNCIDKNKSFQTSAYLDDAEYYLAISYLKNNEPLNSLPLFEKINSQPLHLYHDKVSNWFINKVKIAAWKK